MEYNFSKALPFLLFIGLGLSSEAQNKYTISGTLKDASNGEDLIGASITVKEMSGTGTVTNVYGFYSLTLPEGDYTLQYQFIGLQSQEKPIQLTKDMKIDLELESTAQELQEVVVSAKKEDQNVTANEMSVAKISIKEVENVPVLFGERDLIKVVQLLPGVNSAGEGNSGFYVRGGAADQNLILLDEAPVYNPSHLLGFFSVFNSDALKDVTLYKGGIPAEYGGRASSVMDIKMKEGNSKEYEATGGIGLISSRLTVEGPIQKDKSSFIVSGRRTYLDLFTGLAGDEDISNSTLYFYDLTAKLNYRIGDKDRIFLSGYFGRDELGIDNFGFDWGNVTGTLRWNHIYGDKLFSNTSLIYSDYDYDINIGGDENSFSIGAGIEDWNLKQDFTYFLDARHTLKFGGNIIYHNFVPGDFDGNNESNSVSIDEQYALEGGVYIQDDYKLSQRWGIHLGLRYSFFDYLGPSNAYEFTANGDLISKTTFDNWESIQKYGGLEPRLSVKYQLDESSSLKMSYNRNYQYLHQLSNSTSAQPTDLWVPSSNNIKPQISDQVALGYFRNFSKNMYEFSTEVYYKDLQNQIDYRDGADLLLNENVEGELVYGRGYAYGAEFLLRKNRGKLTGWVSYTLSRSLRQFDDINNGDPFPAKQDRIHDITIVASYQLNPRLTLSANWVYYTGNAVTFPSASYFVAGQRVPFYTERNGYRMPDYHRLDLGVTWINKKTDQFESSWNFSLYNAYNQYNAYTITFQESEDKPGTTEAVQTTLFGIVPSISYNFKF